MRQIGFRSKVRILWNYNKIISVVAVFLGITKYITKSITNSPSVDNISSRFGDSL